MFVAVTLVLWGRLVQVQVFSSEHYRNIATHQWKVTRKVAATRGGIFDRNGRPLALSIRSCSVAVRPDDVEDRARVASVLARHLSMSKHVLMRKLKSKKHFVWVKRQCSLAEAARREIRRLPGVDLHWEADRIYPYGKTAAQLVGFVGRDNVGMAGIEAAFDAELRGEPGWEQVQRDGRYLSRGYGTYASRKPRNGRHVVLTIDATLQEIAELELERAVRDSRARSGALIIMAVRTGEILSLAEYPSAASRDGRARADSLWTIRSVSCVYEPGSTFKLVTAAALLETERVRTFDVFDGENGRARMGSAVISDAHPHGRLTFREGFVLSSNIVMAKAAQTMKRKEFFEYIRMFGFGTRTGVGLLGESPGHVADVKNWSDRTQITIAFGQEIAVTPLQMINAFCAVANDGVLMMPRIVRSIVDESTGAVKKLEPVKVRRVVSRETAARLKEFCRSVVEDGTGRRAAVAEISVAGKTGTAEKASRRGGYMRNKFVSSFVGFAPDDHPKVACLIILDEPNYANRFGGVSAAPVFARVVECIANSSTLFDEVLPHETVGDEAGRRDSFKAPNFLRLDAESAMVLARDLELNILCRGRGGKVVAQEPGPGVGVSRDEVLRLYLSGEMGVKPAGKTPDLRGLSIRLARRRALEAGLRCRVTGSGIVKSQSPRPGAPPGDGAIRIYCEEQYARGRRG